MAAMKASVNLFALLDGNDPGDKRLVDFDSELKDQPKKKPAEPGYKPRQKQLSGQAKKKKPTSSAAATAKNKPASAAASGFKSEKNSPAMAAGYKAPSKNINTPAPSMATATNKQTTPAPQAPSTNLTAVLFAYPSARERILKERQEEFERRQAKARQEEHELKQAKANGGSSVSGNDDDGKSATAGNPSADKKRKGKTHGVRANQGGGGGHYNVFKVQPGVVAVKEASGSAPPAVEEPAPVVKAAPLPPPPSIDDTDQFPSLK